MWIVMLGEHSFAWLPFPVTRIGIKYALYIYIIFINIFYIFMYIFINIFTLYIYIYICTPQNGEQL